MHNHGRPPADGSEYESEREYLMKTITGITELDAFFIFMLLHDTLSPYTSSTVNKLFNLFVHKDCTHYDPDGSSVRKDDTLY